MTETSEIRAKLYTERRMEAAEVLEVAGGTCAIFVSPNPEGAADRINQDSALLVPISSKSAVLAVADGAGGQPAGDKASSTAVNKLGQAILRAVRAESSLREAILNGFEDANVGVLELGVGAGTTLACVEVDGSMLRAYHVGDSTILLVGQRKKLKLLTMSHSPVGYAVQAGVLSAEDALHHEDLAIVSNLVGDAEMRIEVGAPVALSERDTLVIGSDGLFDNLHVDEITDLVATGPLEEAAKKLAAKTMERMRVPKDGKPSKPDDLSFILYRKKPKKRKRPASKTNAKKSA